MLYILGIVLIISLIIYFLSVYNGLRQKVKVEQQVTDIKLRFFTNISHELRTPLTLIVGPVENILQTERISQSVRSQLEIVQSNSQRMLRMVNQLLEFRKVQNQKMKLKVRKTLLSELVELWPTRSIIVPAKICISLRLIRVSISPMVMS